MRCREPLVKRDARFCASCGAPQQQIPTCIGCGQTMVAGAKYCHVCGTQNSQGTSGIHNQGYPGMGPEIRSMPYSPAVRGEPQVNEYNTL